MRLQRRGGLARFILVLAVGGLLGGCSAAPSTESLPMPPFVTALAADTSAGSLLGTGIAPSLFRLIETPSSGLPARKPIAANQRNVLAVSDARADAIELFQGPHFTNIGQIASGIAGPVGEWLDSSSNLYVANSGGADVTEYALGTTSPTCTYSSGLHDPVNVTTDLDGNVYIVDYNFGSGTGYVDLYRQCVDSIVTRYQIAGGPEGAALDASGDLFVSFNDYASGVGTLEEFPSGSRNPKTLGARLAFVGGLAIDHGQNLLVCDQLLAVVDRIGPPYDRINMEYTGFRDPLNVSVSANGKRLFVADPGAHRVQILGYPGGVRFGKLDRADGVSVPMGVAESTIP